MGNNPSSPPPPPPPDPYLSPHKPYSQRKLEYCYKLDGTNNKLLKKVESQYKCPPGWIQNNYVIREGHGNGLNYSSDQNSGVCINPYLDPFSANSETAYVPYDDQGFCNFGETKTIAKFGYGPLFNQYPNNANIPDATPIPNATPPDNTVKHANAPDIWFFPNPPPSNWILLNLPNSSEANIPSTYTCPEGWTQNKDKSDLSSGICTSVGRYEPATKLPDTVSISGARVSQRSQLSQLYSFILGPMYTLYYGPKYNKWPNNNNIPSLSELLVLPPSDYNPFKDEEIIENKAKVTTPPHFYYKQRPYYWPALTPLEQAPTTIYTQQTTNPSIPPPIGNPQLPPYIIPIAPLTAPVTAPAIAPVTTPVIAPVIAPAIAPVTAPVTAPVIAPQTKSDKPETKKEPSPPPSKTLIEGVPDEYLYIGIGVFLLLILLLVVFLI